MNYDFQSRMVFSDIQCTIGTEVCTNRFYLSFPVSNHMVEHSEYYELTSEEFSQCLEDPGFLASLLENCRHRKEDKRLTFFPSALKRGWAI